MTKFGMDPIQLRRIGDNILTQSQNFGQNADKIFQTVQEMVNSNYLSPEALAMAREIEKYKDDLNSMKNIIARYGNACIESSARLIQNQDNIMSGL